MFFEVDKESYTDGCNPDYKAWIHNVVGSLVMPKRFFEMLNNLISKSTAELLSDQFNLLANSYVMRMWAS